MLFRRVPYTFEGRTLAVTLIQYEVPHPSIESSSETDSSDTNWVFYLTMLRVEQHYQYIPEQVWPLSNHRAGDYWLLMNADVEGQTRAVYMKCMVNKMALG